MVYNIVKNKDNLCCIDNMSCWAYNETECGIISLLVTKSYVWSGWYKMELNKLVAIEPNPE